MPAISCAVRYVRARAALMRSCIATVSRVDVATAASIAPRSETARWSAICSAVTTVSAMASSISSAKRASADDRSPRWART